MIFCVGNPVVDGVEIVQSLYVFNGEEEKKRNRIGITAPTTSEKRTQCMGLLHSCLDDVPRGVHSEVDVCSMKTLQTYAASRSICPSLSGSVLSSCSPLSLVSRGFRADPAPPIVYPLVVEAMSLPCMFWTEYARQNKVPVPKTWTNSTENNDFERSHWKRSAVQII